MSKQRILFIHEGKAAYPEIAAYKTYFAPNFAVDELSYRNAKNDPRLQDSITWQMMGFYPRRLNAKLVIHDYRSLSVGFAVKLKDRVKALVNHTPNLRIFQNEAIRETMGFSDDVPHILLPMGVPTTIPEYRSNLQSHMIGDYCYIGSMLPERRINTMIDSFLKRYGTEKTLWLYGHAPDDLKMRFASFTNIVFAGLLPQEELFTKLRAFRACVCYFPNHYPHILQTPTKLLEYAALGLRVIANEHPQSRIAERDYNISCLWGPAHDMFADAPDQIDWAANDALDCGPMLWPRVIAKSEIDDALRRLFT